MDLQLGPDLATNKDGMYVQLMGAPWISPVPFGLPGPYAAQTRALVAAKCGPKHVSATIDIVASSQCDAGAPSSGTARLGLSRQLLGICRALICLRIPVYTPIGWACAGAWHACVRAFKERHRALRDTPCGAKPSRTVGPYIGGGFGQPPPLLDVLLLTVPRCAPTW